MAEFYTDSKKFSNDFVENEYLLLHDINGVLVDKMCY